MKVRILTLAAGPEGNFRPGDIADFPETKAAEWIEAGYAAAVDPPRAKPAPEPPGEPEVAEAPEEAERAVQPEPRRRGKGGRG